MTERRSRKNDGKVVAITGASSGIGQATARLLARLGHAGVLGARREPVLATLAAELTGAGGREDYRVTDVTRRADLEALVEHAFAGPTAVGFYMTSHPEAPGRRGIISHWSFLAMAARFTQWYLKRIRNTA